MSRLRDNVGLLEDAAEFIQYARGPFGKMYTAEDVAGRILDAVDRALATPSPETGTAAVPTAGIKVDGQSPAGPIRRASVGVPPSLTAPLQPGQPPSR